MHVQSQKGRSMSFDWLLGELPKASMEWPKVIDLGEFMTRSELPVGADWQRLANEWGRRQCPSLHVESAANHSRPAVAVERRRSPGISVERRRSLQSRLEYSDASTRRSHLAPFSLWLWAVDYFNAARAAPSSPPGDRTFHPARAGNACQALELALKAFLCQRGVSLDSLRSRGHDLARLVSDAEAADLAALMPLTTEHRAALDSAVRYHSEKVLDYPSLLESLTDYWDRPDVDGVLRMVEELLKVLEPECRRSLKSKPDW